MGPAEKKLRKRFHLRSEVLSEIDAAMVEAYDDGIERAATPHTNAIHEAEDAGEERGRRAAFEEAARHLERRAEKEKEADYPLSPLLAVELEHEAKGIRALAGQPPPDTGWRDRPPTAEEIEAHDKEHRGYFSGAPWAVRVKADLGDDHEWGVVWHTPSSYAPWSWSDVHKEADYFDRWRPLSRDMFPARWPPPERDVECLCGNNVGAICPLHSSGAD